MAKEDDPQPWLELNLHKPTTLDRIALREKFNRIRAFQLQIHTSDGWRTLHEGKQLDTLVLSLPRPVTTQKLRLVITQSVPDGALRGPGIMEFDVYLARYA